MDYSHSIEDVAMDADADINQWTEWPHGPRSDSRIYERMNPFDTSSHPGSQHMSTESRYGLDSYHQENLNWSQSQQSTSHFTSPPPIPPLHLTHSTSDPTSSNIALFDRTYSHHSSLASPPFDTTSFLSVSPQPTPDELPGSGKRSSYFSLRSGPQSPTGSSAHDDSTATPATAPATATTRKKERAQHNIVEHRYREKLNAQIAQLRDRVPALREAPAASNRRGGGVAKGGDSAAKVGKSTVLVKAGEYIEKLETENARLRKRNDSLERLVQRLVQGREGPEGGM